MLRWRLVLGTLIIATLVGLGWLDHHCGDAPGALGLPLLPVAVAFAVLASGDLIHLANAGGIQPLPWAVYGGNLLLLASHWLPVAGGSLDAGRSCTAPMAGVLVALAIGCLAVLLGEMSRYRKPGGVLVNAATAVLCLVYVGGMLSFAVQLRMAWGLGALASLVFVVKAGDIGAYSIGRLVGRHKLAPVLSPGKTVEGAIGALVFACFGSWACFAWLVPFLAPEGAKGTSAWGWMAFGLLVGLAGMLGDLAESLLKRDVGCKDSSRWLPGFGGVLDILDSILFAAPVAWLCWALGLVGG